MIAILKRAVELAQQAEAKGIHLRLLGGLAVKYRCKDKMDYAPFSRDYDDMDFVVPYNESLKLVRWFKEIGISSNERFNTMNGDKRLICYDGDEETGTKLDIFVGKFEMCHKFDFNKTWTICDITEPIEYLYMTKMQVVEVNNKDLTDTLALILFNEFGMEKEKFHLDILAKLCGDDWGLHHTIELNTRKLQRFAEKIDISPEYKQLAAKKLNCIIEALANCPKSLKWKARSVIGESLKWYELPEDAQRAAEKINN